MRRSAYALLLLVMMPALVYGQTVSAVWDPNPPEDQISGYQVCIGRASLSCDVQLATVPASETSYAFTLSPGVLYWFAVRATNPMGTGAYSAEVAASIPSLAQPANQTSTVNVPIGPLNLSVSDPDGSALQFSHSGLPLGLSLNQNTGVITGTPTSAGAFNVIVFVADDLETTSRTFTWTVQSGGGSDATAPSLAITSHTSGQTVTTSSITLAGTASDNGAGGNGITGVWVNGSNATGGTASGSNTASWSRGVSLSMGSNTLTVVATDGAGNTRTSTVTITRATAPDATAPTLSITSHSSGQTVSSSSITLTGTATDNGTGGSGIASVTVNGTAASGGTASGNGTSTWSANVALAVGANVLTVVATDGAGNPRTTSITINRPTADTTRPSLSITSHTSGQTLTSGTITLAGTATDSGSGGSGISSVTVNGSNASGGTASGNNTANWSRALTLPAGDNVITVIATDGAGNVRSIPITLNSPSSAPSRASVSANRTSPQTQGTAITLSATASGGVGPLSYKWWAQMNGGNWSLLQDWGSSTLNWTPSVAGSYTIGLWVRSSGVSADAPQTTAALTFLVTPGSAPAAPPPSSGSMTGVSLSANRVSPQVSGTTVTLTANGSGGSAPYSFKWWAQMNGGAWTLLQDWSTSANLAWTPSQSGTYLLAAWARSAGATADTPQTVGSITFVINGSSSTPPPPSSSTPMTSVTVTTVGTVAVGRSLSLVLGGAGGSGPYSFKVWLQRDGGAWELVRDWSTSTTLNWTARFPGNYQFGVWGRSAGATADTPQAVGVANVAVYQ